MASQKEHAKRHGRRSEKTQVFSRFIKGAYSNMKEKEQITKSNLLHIKRCLESASMRIATKVNVSKLLTDITRGSTLLHVCLKGFRKWVPVIVGHLVQKYEVLLIRPSSVRPDLDMVGGVVNEQSGTLASDEVVVEVDDVGSSCFDINLLDRFFAKKLHTVKCIPPRLRLGFAKLFRCALDNVLARPNDLSVWVQLLILPGCVLSTFVPTNRAQRRSVERERCQFEGISRAILRWKDPADRLGLVLDRLARATPSIGLMKKPKEQDEVNLLTDRSELPNIVDPVIRDTMVLKHLYQVAAVPVICVQSEPSYIHLITDVLHSLIPLVPTEIGRGSVAVNKGASNVAIGSSIATDGESVQGSFTSKVRCWMKCFLELLTR
ncbi:hypothetical protein CTI12_AA346090 [Artemisia annua]|uniref:Uncharacterized protein n=1 Tax=Artemisia annua TaxID=35608 RepID=A0A2U1MSG6_ARTAN|nr:hypothetical protein CTI12_AA346090 [Artemisia annua]